MDKIGLQRKKEENEARRLKGNKSDCVVKRKL